MNERAMVIIIGILGVIFGGIQAYIAWRKAHPKIEFGRMEMFPELATDAHDFVCSFRYKGGDNDHPVIISSIDYFIWRDGKVVRKFANLGDRETLNPRIMLNPQNQNGHYTLNLDFGEKDIIGFEAHAANGKNYYSPKIKARLAKMMIFFREMRINGWRMRAKINKRIDH